MRCRASSFGPFGCDASRAGLDMSSTREFGMSRTDAPDGSRGTTPSQLRDYMRKTVVRGNADEHRGEWVWRDGAVASWTKGVGWWDRPGSFSETDGPPPVGLTRPSFDTTDEESSELSPDGGATVLGQFGWTRLREALDTLQWSELSSTLCRRTHSPRRRVNDGIHDFDG